MLEKSFQHYWAELFIEKTKEDNSFYPLILSNSSATHIQRGIASTVDFGDAFDTIFHDAIDILDHDEKSISYAYGASSSNRFPVFSPVAKIASKGHFLDGGYFENSGLSSLLDLYDYLKKEAGCMPKTVILLQIV